MKPAVKNTIKYTAFAGLAFLLLFFAFRNVDPAELWDDLKHAHYGYVFASVLMGYAAIVSRGLRWKLLLEPLGYHPKTWNAIHSVSALYFVNLALPRAGELARCTSLNQVEDIPVNKLFGTVLLERTIDMVFLLFIVAAAVVVNLSYLEQLFAMTNTGSEEGGGMLIYILVGLAALAVIVFFAFRQRIQASPLFAKVRDFYEGLKDGFKAVFKMKKKAQAAFWFHSVFIWLCYFFMVYVCFFAIEETAHLTIADGLFIMVAASLGIVIPVPGGIGAYHYLVGSAMVVLGFTHEIGLGFATIVHSAQTLMLLGTGAIAMFILYLERRRRKKSA